MRTHSKTNATIPEVSGLPLFDWIAALSTPATRAGLHISRRFHVSPSIADVIAELAGLGERGARS